MPLSKKSLDLLTRLQSVDCGGTLGDEQNKIIKDTFKQILSSGDVYKIDEVETWLRSHLTSSPAVIERILNVAHYQKAKHDANNPLKMASDSCGCGGDC